ncbi:acetyl-CoA carboxylase biotin carboxyl carrier protein subunit [Tamlana fucoidanivorans]|uniref:Acetyl-CoA carboxylase biotin carboxyl carrier protein subunit n=1 Tax=Allotamlana fucoidanivorans TaxID=2583814 RepID=A0A5C4SEY5_9FLAO|nr:acetyl-CoA carboxylase biotin carboxyl carrier protein subunit [Tamlana fucoidanivorans]TNJ42139.1 acetyl-CoA carboxylase biotin carboxyl carrier protein subunit [Tamlana fucoidanivorans]
MNHLFKVKVNDVFEYELSKNNLKTLDPLKVSKNQYHILHEYKSFQTEILKSDFDKKCYHVKVDNNVYEVRIKNKLDELIDNMGFSSSHNKQINTIKAPMPGLILDIKVSVGQVVNENDSLLILEAMKMENVIASPRSGVIKSVTVEIGNAVEKNQLLIEFE